MRIDSTSSDILQFCGDSRAALAADLIDGAPILSGAALASNDGALFMRSGGAQGCRDTIGSVMAAMLGGLAQGRV